MPIICPKTLPFESKLVDEVRQILERAERIVIISHRGPDGDTIGSNLALKHALKQWGKTVVSACINPPPDYSFMLTGSYEYVNDFNLNDFDVAMAVDCGAHYMMKFHETKPELLRGKIPLINIDHHPSNDNFGTHNLVHDTAAAAVFTIYHLLKHWNLQITRDIANSLMMGLYYDTGSFMHSNTKPEVLTMAADLQLHGADIKNIVKVLFKTTPVEQLKLWGRVMQRARVNQRQAVISAVTDKDYRECGADQGSLSGVIDLLNSVSEARLAILLSEDQKGQIKGSMRTQNEDIDLSQLASLFGGGGHKKAAGFSVPGRLQKEIVWKIVNQ